VKIKYIFWLYQGFRRELLAVPGKVIALIFVIFLFLLPLITTEPYVLRIYIFSAIFAIYASSWDLLAGFTGQISLGHASFFGVAAYAVALLNIKFGLPPWITILAGSAAAVVIGLIVGVPALRLRGFYLSLVTLSFPIILSGIILVFPGFTGGELGLYGIGSLASSQILTFYVVTIVMLCSVLAMWKLTDAHSKIVRVGVILHAIREDEITARASGISTTKYKLLAFATSGFFAGIAGGLYAHFLRVAGPSNLDLFFSFQPILWTIFGGIGTIYGAIAGVYILYPLVEFARYNPVVEQVRFIIFAVILILTLFFMPEGITRWVRDKIEVDCPRCKLINITTRRYCRACRAPLHLEKEKSNDGKEGR
jgi:branched-chain amino acid transport system permease protein